VSKAKGSRAERRAIRLLEADGYVCTKAGGSLGVFDIIANRPDRCPGDSGEGGHVEIDAR
jgi:Holliday junction resolvase